MFNIAALRRRTKASARSKALASARSKALCSFLANFSATRRSSVSCLHRRSAGRSILLRAEVYRTNAGRFGPPVVSYKVNRGKPPRILESTQRSDVNGGRPQEN